MPPVPKFCQFLLMMTLFLGSTIALMMVFIIFGVIQERKKNQWISLTLEEMITYLILF